MANFIPSPYQQKIYDFINLESGNAVIDAVAGSGKSTTLVNALKLIPGNKSVLFLAFNKSIVEELRIKIGNLPNVEIRTLHSLGSSIIMKNSNCQIQNDKYRAWINQGLKFGHFGPNLDLSDNDFNTYKSNILKLVDLVRVNLCKTILESEELAFKHDLILQDNELQIVSLAIKFGKQQNNIIDFTDMIYFPNVKDYDVQTYDWVFIDECQDLNAAQRELFLKCVNPQGGRFIAVGDPRQAIYGFAGADVKSFNILKNTPHTVSLPLSVCYRCGSDIIDLAKSIVPQIEAAPGAKTGKVNRDARMSEIMDGDLVICRLTAPLVSLCMKFISEGRKAHIKGKDIGENLINMVKKTNKTNIAEAVKVMEKELSKIAQKVSKSRSCSIDEAKDSPQYKGQIDKIEAIQILAEGLTQVRQLISRIDSIFNDNNNKGISLSTIHKAKGLEADNVFIACPDKLYNKRAMKIDWMAEQETNLVYVAYTRAKNYLGFITDFNI